MSKPSDLKTKIFLDGGDPKETREVIQLLGFLDGQTTNPSLIAKNPDAQKRLAEGKKFSKEEVYGFYRGVVEEISEIIPGGSVSVEVYADKETSAGEMFREGSEMFSWIPNAHIKFPTTGEGLSAAERATWDGIRINMTLCFTENQAVAVYAATRGASHGDVFVSPFVGRLDDLGENGMNLIANILEAYKNGDGHTEVLTASVRNLDHFLEAIRLGSDIITAPYKILKEWADKGMVLPDESFSYNPKGFRSIPYLGIDLAKTWQSYDIKHELTDKGLERFAKDWNSLIG